MYLWLKIILDLSTYVAWIIMLAMLPFFTIASLFAFALPAAAISRSDEPFDDLAVFSVAVSSSLSFTLLALAIGHSAEPQAWVLQTIQMLASNALFDGATMITTLRLLSWAVSKRKLASIPLALLFAFVASAAFAFGSLWLGLFGTSHALTLKDVAHILVARSADGFRWEIGPSFWVMHSTFLPTAMYLTAVAWCWLGKALLLAIEWFFGQGKENDNPLPLTSALFGLIAAVLGLPILVLNVLA